MDIDGNHTYRSVWWSMIFLHFLRNRKEGQDMTNR